MKKILILLLLAPFALNAIGDDLETFWMVMDATQKNKPIEIYLTPVSGHARVDRNQATLIGTNSICYNGNRHTMSQGWITRDTPSLTGIFATLYSWINSVYPVSNPTRTILIGHFYRDIEMKILEIIPNNEKDQFTALYSFKKNKDASPYLGAIIAKHGEKIPLGDETNGVQYFLGIPEKKSRIEVASVNAEDLSDDARTFLALFAQAPANTNNNNNQ